MTKQLTPEELQSITDLQKQYNTFVFELGNVEAQIQLLLTQKEALENEKKGIVSDINTVFNKEREVVGSLQEKYGAGHIDPTTGEITPL